MREDDGEEDEELGPEEPTISDQIDSQAQAREWKQNTEALEE